MMVHHASTKSMVFRLHPGDDLKESLQAIVRDNHIDAAYVAACVGSLNQASLRLANRDATTNFEGPFEIVSLTGTISHNGSHLHLAVSDSNGKTIGGHLMDGNTVYTTAEIVIGILDELVFDRTDDPETGCKELSIRNKQV